MKKKIHAGAGLPRLLFILVLSLITAQAFGQYFGRNKPQYESFDFKILTTPHFDIYNYLENDSVMNNIGLQSERWYKRHQQILRDTFDMKNPIIIYNNHADFQQTDVVGGLIGVGTGGVTEALKNRVVFPFLQTYGQTDHVLGHELVHAFQYHMIIHGDSTSLKNMQNLPLWMVEGLAEYLSIGRIDPHTAMWMRDAVISEDIPSLKEMSVNPKYFPYRYGQAFWSFTTGVYGDTIIAPLFTETAKVGYDLAMRRIMKIDEKTFSSVWKNTLIEAYKPFMGDTIQEVGTKLFSAKNAGEMNLSPVFSPDGRYIAFLSEKDVLSVDLYLAEAKTGKILRKLTRPTNSFHIDDFSYVESAGTFSPDGNRFAYVAFSKGKNILVITETVNGKTLEEIEMDDLVSFNDPAWSPDGRYIALSGLKNGKTDLYLYNYVNHKLTQLTNDLHSEIQPSWSSDGKKLVFVSDRGSDTNLEDLVFGSYKIATLDLETRQLETLDFFPGADNMNPHFSKDNTAIYFLSNADGMRNLYEYNISNGEINKMTKYFTGISGITQYSPAISVNRTNDDIAYTIYRNSKYTIYKANSADFPRFRITPDSVDFTASTLPPHKNLSPRAVTEQPNNRVVKTASIDSFYTKDYASKLGLSFISNNGGFGVGTSAMGTGFAGGVNALFTDMLNNHQLYTGLQLNGEIYDFGAQAIYLNRKGAFTWGGGLSHIPYTFMDWPESETFPDSANGGTRYVETWPLYRIFQDQATILGQIPFSQTLRLEAGASFSRYYYRSDLYQFHYLIRDGFQYYLGSEREKGDAPEGFNLGNVYLAYVGDNSRFGVTAPLDGRRYRFQVEKYFGQYNYYTTLADYRQYFFTNPLSFAFRGLYYARYGSSNFGFNNNNQMFIGSEYLVRGYNVSQRELSVQENLTIDQLLGTRMAVFNAEIRFPFTGPRRLALIKSGLLFSDLGLFADAGLTWSKGQPVELKWSPGGTNASPIMSVGATLRVNLFNMIILEPYYAIPFQREDTNGVFGLILSSGGW